MHESDPRFPWQAAAAAAVGADGARAPGSTVAGAGACDGIGATQKPDHKRQRMGLAAAASSKSGAGPPLLWVRTASVGVVSEARSGAAADRYGRFLAAAEGSSVDRPNGATARSLSPWLPSGRRCPCSCWHGPNRC